MMVHVTLIFVLFVASCVSICKSQSNCSEISIENKFLSNIDKLLNMNQVKIMYGMTLRKKDNLSENNQIMCNNSTWMEALGGRVKRMMQTHVVEFDLASIMQKEHTDTDTVTPRRRRHQQGISMMLMGISLFLMIFVPMGFNFLSALGGKAFLMAKLALLLASVNGLKRVANGGVHYGLYQTLPEPNMQHYGYDRYDRPRRKSFL